MSTITNHGKRLDLLLLEMGISKKDFAEKLGIMQPNLSHWLKEYLFTDEKLDRVCKALGITIDQFLQETDTVNDTIVTIHNPNGELQLMRELLNEKERTIKILLKQYCDENKKNSVD